jgi:hypothetical protein
MNCTTGVNASPLGTPIARAMRYAQMRMGAATHRRERRLPRLANSRMS